MLGSRLLATVAALFIALPFIADGATSEWLSAPMPLFPTSALKKGSEGSVTLQIVLGKDGHVNLDRRREDGVRIVASVALILRGRLLSEHFPLTADSLQSLARKVAAEVNKRELDNLRRADAPQKGLTNR